MCPRPPLAPLKRIFYDPPPSKNFYDPPLAPKSLHTYVSDAHHIYLVNHLIKNES